MCRRLATSFVCLLAFVAVPALAQSTGSCPFSDASALDGVLIGYLGNARQTRQSSVTTRVGSFRALGILRGGTLVPSDGNAIRNGMEFWRVLDPAAAPTTLQQVSSFLDRLGEDHCVYHAEAATDLASFTLLSSRPLPDRFARPSASDLAYFSASNETCVAQGDAPDPRPYCRRLLAVSDIDGDGMPEYWATEPYIQDTGITVWQRTEDGLSRLLAVCAGCSD